MKRIFNIIKRIVVSIMLIYGVNLIINPLDIVLPINLFSVLMFSFFGIPGFVTFLLLFFLV